MVKAHADIRADQRRGRKAIGRAYGGICETLLDPKRKDIHQKRRGSRICNVCGGYCLHLEQRETRCIYGAQNPP